MQLRTQITFYRITAHWQGQARFALPPNAEIENLRQTLFVIRYLPFVDQQSGIDTSRGDRFYDSIERDDFILELRRMQAQHQVGARQRSRNRDPARFEL